MVNNDYVRQHRQSDEAIQIEGIEGDLFNSNAERPHEPGINADTWLTVQLMRLSNCFRDNVRKLASSVKRNGTEIAGNIPCSFNGFKR